MRLQYYKKNKSPWKLLEADRRANIQTNSDLADMQKAPETEQEEYGRNQPRKNVRRC
jgi:hypothetical protein